MNTFIYQELTVNHKKKFQMKSTGKLRCLPIEVISYGLS